MIKLTGIAYYVGYHPFKGNMGHMLCEYSGEFKTQELADIEAVRLAKMGYSCVSEDTIGWWCIEGSQFFYFEG